MEVWSHPGPVARIQGGDFWWAAVPDEDRPQDEAVDQNLARYKGRRLSSGIGSHWSRIGFRQTHDVAFTMLTDGSRVGRRSHGLAEL